VLDLYAYHLRVVRVTGAGADGGAALGWNSDDGEPVVLPAYEAWGSPEQLEGLARTLGGESASAVTGFFLTSEDGTVPRFDRKVYLGEKVLDLSFQAYPPAGPDDGHQLFLRVEPVETPGEPLAEAKLRVQTDRTVAIANPVSDGDEWLVLAVTLLENEESLARMQGSVEKILKVGLDDVESPEIISRVEPKYPLAAKKERLSGNVVLQVVIDENGVPRAPMVMKMTEGCEELAATAVDSVLQWRYEPATRMGEPVAVYMSVMMKFSLQ
jgi:protein TonB